MNILKSLLIMGMASISASVTAEVDNTAAISSVSSQWSETLNKGETSDLIKLYADDAVVLPPSSEILSDKSAIKNYWDGLRKVGVNKYSISTVNLKIEGDKAYQTALWEASRNADGKVIQFEGNISNVLERQKDGSWKITLQSWN